MCNNETKEVGVLDSFYLNSSGDGSNTSVVGRCLAALTHGERLLSPVGMYDKVLLNNNCKLVATSTARDNCVASVK